MKKIKRKLKILMMRRMTYFFSLSLLILSSSKLRKSEIRKKDIMINEAKKDEILYPEDKFKSLCLPNTLKSALRLKEQEHITSPSPRADMKFLVCKKLVLDHLDSV